MTSLDVVMVWLDVVMMSLDDVMMSWHHHLSASLTTEVSVGDAEVEWTKRLRRHDLRSFLHVGEAHLQLYPHTHTLAPINVSSIQTLVVKYFSPQRALYILNYIGLNQKSFFLKILHNVRSYTTIITVFYFLSTFLCHCNTFRINSALILPDGRLSVQMQSCWQIRPWRRQKHRHMSVTVSSIICYCTQCRICV